MLTMTQLKKRTDHALRIRDPLFKKHQFLVSFSTHQPMSF
ncbi:hypothetical protein Bhyg_03507 [Pseudolycoriella hygida]|uniref:Uncharacterized protein n=1 Tax=Pseudolycoriella hygida TaxID=35572 RepID=A0A9Q0S7K6_9DIPT|nr:hypothetical protein Bhyg_03507 [Pseudolycoriella hygida]